MVEFEKKVEVILILKGINLNQLEGGATPLHGIISSSLFILVSFFFLFFIVACHGAHYDCVALLLVAGADRKLKSNLGKRQKLNSRLNY
jgi:hypothetical protein